MEPNEFEDQFGDMFKDLNADDVAFKMGIETIVGLYKSFKAAGLQPRDAAALCIAFIITGEEADGES